MDAGHFYPNAAFSSSICSGKLLLILATVREIDAKVGTKCTVVSLFIFMLCTLCAVIHYAQSNSQTA